MKSNSAIEEEKKAADKAVEQALAKRLHLEYPDHTPEPTDSKLLELGGHLTYCSLEHVLRPARIMAALKEIPFDKIKGGIRTDASALDKASNKRQLDERELGKLNAMLSNIYDGSTSDSRATELEGQKSTLMGVLAVAGELNRACDKLFQELSKASRLISPIQNMQNMHQRGWVGIGKWAASLPLIHKMSVESKAKSLAKVANDALAEIERLQAGELPVLRNTSSYSVILNVQFDEKE